MDNVLSEFISKTSAEPGLARDLLESNKWKLNEALVNFDILKCNFVSTNLDEDLDLSKLKDENDVKECCSSPTLVKSNSQPSIANKSQDEIEKVKIDLNKKSEEEIENKLQNAKSISKIDNLQSPVVPKKLFRGISRACTDNIHLVSKVRQEFAQDFQAIKDNDLFDGKLNLELPEHTFTLPDISIHPDDFRQFLEKDLIEKSTLLSLKAANRLNWWAEDELNVAQKLWPLATTGDGNCLLHACSLGTWGFHDRLLTLRKALHYYLINSSSNVDTFYKRWRYQCSLENKKAGLILSEDEWTSDWQSLLKMASTEPRVIGSNHAKTTKTLELNGGKKDVCEEEFVNHVYESLEEIHILALAHVLKRPIIVIADIVLRDVKNEPFAPIPFGGIYLPLQIDPKECNRSPLCLTYDAAHFSSLVAMDHESFADRTPLPPAVVPLVDCDGKLLPVQFVVEPPNDLDWSKLDADDEAVINQLSVCEKDKLDLLDKYLDLIFIDKTSKETFTNEEFKSKQKHIADQTDQVENDLVQIVISSAATLPPMSSSKLIDLRNLSRSTNLTSSDSMKEMKSRKEEPKKSHLLFLNSLQTFTLKLASIKRSMSKRLKRNMNSVNTNVNNLVRRSSLRISRRISKLHKSESQNKSATHLDANTTNANLSNSSTINKSPSQTSNKSSKSSSPNKSSKKSPSKLTAPQSPDRVTSDEQDESIIPSNFILAADMHIDNQPAYRDEFIFNYLSTARMRFDECDSRSNTEKSVLKKGTNSSEYSSQKGSTMSCASISSTSSNHFKEDYAQCVNTGCVNFGKSSTNYLCEDCLCEQKKELIEIRTNNESTTH